MPLWVACVDCARAFFRWLENRLLKWPKRIEEAEARIQDLERQLKLLRHTMGEILIELDGDEPGRSDQRSPLSRL